MNVETFLSKSKCIIEFPAGYGKTYKIAECLQRTQGRQLILTHTHAGVASLKEKIQEFRNIPKHKYAVETISSFAQTYVRAYYCGSDIPDQESKEYFPFVIKKAKNIMQSNVVRQVIQSTYTGVFVDEYQDCSIDQHEFILALADSGLPIRIFGDYMQGIFNFGHDGLVDLNKDVQDFERIELPRIPWRWKKSGRENLGKSLENIRSALENNEEIDLDKCENEIEVVVCDNNSPFGLPAEYVRELWGILNAHEDVLIIHPESNNKQDRKAFAKLFKGKVYFVEAIDDNDFYKFSKKLDELQNSQTIYTVEC